MWSILFSLFLNTAAAQSNLQLPQGPQEQNFDIPMPIECGLVTKFASHKIGDGCLQKADNVIFDRDVGVQRRQGYGQFNATALTDTQAVRRIYPFNATDGSEYLMAVSSSSIFQSGTGGVFSVPAGLTGLSSTLNTDCVQGLGRFWCTNQTDGLFYWDGTSTAAVSGDPAGRLVDVFRNRILTADVSGNQSRLYGSGHLDGTNWTTAAASTSPFIISIGGTNDGEKINCLMGTHNDAYLIGTKNRLYALYGFDNDDFVIREISREFGCLDDTSVQEMDGDLYWLSRRGIERRRGTSIDWKVSYPVIDQIQAIIDSAGNTRNAVDTSQADFNSGNITASGPGAPMSTTITPASVVVATFTGVDTSSTNFADGTQTNTSTTTAGQIEMGNALTNIGFGYSSPSQICNPVGSVDNIQNWSCTGTQNWTVRSSTESSNVSAACTSQSVVSGNSVRQSCHPVGSTGTVRVLNAADDSVIYSNTHTSADDCTVQSINTTTQTIANFKIEVIGMDGSSSFKSDSFPKTGNVVYVPNFPSGCIPSTNKIFAVDFPEPFYVASATFTSREFDTGFSTPTWGVIRATTTIPSSGGSIIFRTQVATSPAGVYDSVVTESLESNIASAKKRYVKYQAVFASVVSTSTPSAQAVELNAATTGYFISQCRNPGTAITSWGIFSCNTAPNNGALSFAISTAATCHAATRSTATWNAQTNNSAITIATAPFVAYRVLFDLDVASETPTLQDCTINWEEGGARPEVASGVHEHRYHIFYTTGASGTPVNNEALVLDQFDRWSHWNNIPSRSAGQYRGDLLIGSGASTGKIYRLYTGNDDDGSSFTTDIRTKDFDLGNWRARKTFGQLSLELSPALDSTANVALSVTAYVDIANSYSLGTVNLTEDSGVIAAKVPWPLATQVSGRYISIELSDTGTQPWRFYRGALRSKTLRED